MTQEEIIQGNKLIAEFIGGFERINKSWCFPSEMPYFIKIYSYPKIMRFHKSWNWLMLVIDYLQHTDNCIFCVTIDENVCKIWSEDSSYVHELVSSSTIKAVYEAIIKFIKWYNNE